MEHEERRIKQYIGPKCHYQNESELCEFYIQMNIDCNDNPSRAVWEWLRNAPYLDDFNLDKFKIWKEDGKVVSLIRPTSQWMGEAVIDNRCSNEETLYEMIQYLEDNLSLTNEEHTSLFVILFDQANDLEKLLLKNGYEKITVEKGTLQFHLENRIEQPTLPNGFIIKPLSEVYDFDQLNKLIWFVFHYEGEIPAIDADVRRSIKHAWLNYNKDVCSVVLDQNGEYASFCGFWYDEITQTAYLEPMVTQEKYQHMGLGKAAVYHSLDLLQKRGCKKVFVDPDEDPYPYYLHIGFEHFECARYFNKTNDKK